MTSNEAWNVSNIRHFFRKWWSFPAPCNTDARYCLATWGNSDIIYQDNYKKRIIRAWNLLLTCPIFCINLNTKILYKGCKFGAVISWSERNTDMQKKAASNPQRKEGLAQTADSLNIRRNCSCFNLFFCKSVSMDWHNNHWKEILNPHETRRGKFSRSCQPLFAGIIRRAGRWKRWRTSRLSNLFRNGSPSTGDHATYSK